MANRDSNKYIKNVSAFHYGNIHNGNTPAQYKDRHKQYMAERTAMFDANRAYLSTDYVNAEVQGLIEEDFYAWVNTNIRFSDISNSSSSGGKKIDDCKQVLFPELGIEYFPLGAKIKTMGNTWLSINPSNISSVKTKAIVERCNTSYNSYDYYGNVVTEPIIVESASMFSNGNEYQKNIVLMNGYFNVTCQLNENTAVLKENSRIILGRKAYHITGVTDCIQEFTGDRGSCHLLNFTARVEEPTESDDITENFIASGKEFEFDCILQGVDNIPIGKSVVFTPHFIKNGELVESTKEKPISWEWESEDDKLASVDNNGSVKALSSGIARITARMVQNPSISATIDILIGEEQIVEHKVVFTSVVPDRISQFDSTVISAAYIENGTETNNPLKWDLNGTDRKKDYSVEVLGDGRSVEVTCLSPSKKNLKITASYGEYSTTAEIELLGY